jgi:hypothetical protein
MSHASQEIDPVRLRKLAQKARRLADGVRDSTTRERLSAAAAEFEQRAKEVEIDDITGQ